MRMSKWLPSTMAVVVLLSGLPSTSTGAIAVDRTTTYQTIEGFGFFGARGAWWDSGDPAHFYSDAWLDLMFSDLGATMWRNEVYPHIPVTASASGQDANWDKQRPAALAIADYCKARNIPLKTLLSIWSPPRDFKCLIEEDPNDPNVQNFLIGQRPADTKGGNVLDPQQVTAFRDWLVSALQMYKDAGLNVYAMSLQNEPFFWTGYNSCFYYPGRADGYDYPTYMQTINPGIQNFTNVNGSKVLTFGPENMLEIEAKEESYQYFYHNSISNDPAALATLDRWALHGYTDGINSQDPASALDCWRRHYEVYAQPTGKPVWQTEISNYANNSWNDLETGDTKLGAFSLGLSIQISLLYGKVSSWVWWQGTDSNLNPYSLTGWDLSKGRTFYASKQFYRFIRPGATMVDVTSSDPGLVVTALEHTGLGNFVVVICNDSPNETTTSITGNNVPATFTGFQSSGAENDTCRNIGTVDASSVTVPAFGILTLVDGNFIETDETGVDPDSPRTHATLHANVGIHQAAGRLSVSGATDDCDVAVMDLRGRLAARGGNARGETVIDIPQLRTGPYVAVVRSSHEVIARRLIVIGE